MACNFWRRYTWSKSIDDSSQADDNVTWLGSLSSLQDPNKPWLETEPLDLRHSVCVQFSYSYDLPFGHGTGIPGQHAAVGRCDHRRVEDERHLAHRRWPAADFHALRTATRFRHMAGSDPTSWERPSAIMARIGWTTTLSDNSVFQRPDDFHPGQCSARDGKHPQPLVVHDRSVCGKAIRRYARR